MAAAAAAAQDSSWLARHYIDYVYIPGALLVVGTLIVKREWAPYSILLALVLGAYNFWNFRESRRPSPLSALLCLALPLPHTTPLHGKQSICLPADTTASISSEIKKVLKPDVFQEFELQEKTVISHNVAM